ncbi:MAG: hypothetical protein RSG92_15275 [Pseudomonas sp.]
MTKRKPALSTQLKASQAEVAALQKKLESSEQHQKWARESADKANTALNDVHAFLDAVPNPPARKAGEEGYGAERSLMTRLAVYLSTRS